MKKLKFLFMALFAGLVLSGCSQEELELTQSCLEKEPF